MMSAKPCALAIGMILTFSGAACGATYNEATQGDLPATGDAPTRFTLGLGDNTLDGSAGTSASGVDYDLVTLEVPVGLQLQSVFLTRHQISFGLSFMGWQHGGKWTTGFGNSIEESSLFRYQLFERSYIGFDLLPDVDLPSGLYTIEIQDIHLPFNYGFNFRVTAVPEPEGMAFGMLAAWGLAAFRRSLNAVG